MSDSSRRVRIVLDDPQIRELFADGLTAVEVDGVRVEFTFPIKHFSHIAWLRMVRAILESALSRVTAGHPLGAPDPPQAVEFLPLSQQPKRRQR